MSIVNVYTAQGIIYIYTTQSEMAIKSKINVQYWHAYYGEEPIC